MPNKKGYGIVIPNDWRTGKWDDTDAKEILTHLKELTCDAFQRMIREVDVDLMLLKESGYKYKGVAELAVKELEAYLSQDKFQEVKDLITWKDYEQEGDFRYILRLYIDRHDVVRAYYSEELAKEISDYYIGHALMDERESVRQLMELFIYELHKDETDILKNVLARYGGHLVYIPEYLSLVAAREFIAWFRGDSFELRITKLRLQS